MKKIYILIFSLMISISYSQDMEYIGKYLEFTDNISIYEASKISKIARGAIPTIIDIKDDDTFELNGNKVSIKKGWLLKIYSIQDGIYIITILDDDPTVIGKYFALTKQQRQSYTQIVRGDEPWFSFASSAVTIPVKIRFGDDSKESGIRDENGFRRRFSDFEGNANVGAAVGFRIKASKIGFDYFNFLGGINVGATSINNDTAEVETETNAGILTPFIGVLYEYKGFELGVFYGWDHISGSIGRTWVYQGKPWLGVGIGYKIFVTRTSSKIK
jgi:hypothetical protein